jgi:AcrR family transcriptional regulator
MPRKTYHHGDLRRALTAAALDLLRAGGPEAVTIREVARRAEVSPAAIYRHFPDRDALLAELGRIARDGLARRMLDEQARVAHVADRQHATDRLLALGRGYLEFARSDPQLLAAAFLPFEPADGPPEDPNPWKLLSAALDDLVSVGAMSPARRPGAEVVAWSAVHGFATLRAGRSFETSGERDPDPERLLAAIASALGLEAGRARS